MRKKKATSVTLFRTLRDNLVEAGPPTWVQQRIKHAAELDRAIIDAEQHYKILTRLAHILVVSGKDDEIQYDFVSMTSQQRAAVANMLQLALSDVFMSFVEAEEKE